MTDPKPRHVWPHFWRNLKQVLVMVALCLLIPATMIAALAASSRLFGWPGIVLGLLPLLAALVVWAAWHSAKIDAHIELALLQFRRKPDDD